MDTRGQQQMMTYFQRLETERIQQEVDAEVRVSESHPTPSGSWQQLNLFSIFGWRPMDPEKSPASLDLSNDARAGDHIIHLVQRY